MRQTPALPEGSLVLQNVLGEGTFGKVYTGVRWPAGAVGLLLRDSTKHAGLY
jgi:hypothetical protein